MVFLNERIKCCFLGEKLLWGKNTISKKTFFVNKQFIEKHTLEFPERLLTSKPVSYCVSKTLFQSIIQVLVRSLKTF